MSFLQRLLFTSFLPTPLSHPFHFFVNLFLSSNFVLTWIFGSWTTRLAVLPYLHADCFCPFTLFLAVFPLPWFPFTSYVIVTTCHQRAKHSIFLCSVHLLSVSCLSVSFICPSHIHAHTGFFLLKNKILTLKCYRLKCYSSLWTTCCIWSEWSTFHTINSITQRIRWQIWGILLASEITIMKSWWDM